MVQWRKVKCIVGSLLLLTLIFGWISVEIFSSLNFFHAIIGFVQITTSDMEYVTIQEKPRVILSKPENAWDVFVETLDSFGYTYIPEERMGSLCAFERAGVREYIHFSVNRYYGKWVWL